VRIIRSLVAVGAVAATATALSMAPAMADPVNKDFKQVEPAPYDIVGVGSESIAFVMDQLTYNYNLTVKTPSPSTPDIYSWDATPPNNPLDESQLIATKTGCKKQTRPDGSSAGIEALGTEGTVVYKGKTYQCADFARSSRPRSTTDPVLGPGGVAFVTLADDAVTYATPTNGYAPDDLSLKQLQEIYSCSVKAANGDPAGTWGALLGKKAAKGSSKQKIDPIAPQAGSGTLSFWLETALGFDNDNQPVCSSQYSNSLHHPLQVPEENEGIDKAFLLKDGKPNPNVLYPFSIGSYVSQEFHSIKCGAKRSSSKNDFGCDETGVLFLRSIEGTAPTVTSKGVTTTNPKFDPTFDRTLFDVVRFNTKKQPIPTYLMKFFGPKGVFCSSAYAPVLKDYGFEPTSKCGAIS
jgi:ABC-type phosphate transport system substrate-binding protein